MGVITGVVEVGVAVATGWETGAGADWVHPADKRRAMRRTRRMVPKCFIFCLIYGRVVIRWDWGT